MTLYFLEILELLQMGKIQLDIVLRFPYYHPSEVHLYSFLP